GGRAGPPPKATSTASGAPLGEQMWSAYERRAVRDGDAALGLGLAQDVRVQQQLVLAAQVRVEQVRTVGVDRVADAGVLEGAQRRAQLRQVGHRVRAQVRARA